MKYEQFYSGAKHAPAPVACHSKAAKAGCLSRPSHRSCARSVAPQAHAALAICFPAAESPSHNPQAAHEISSPVCSEKKMSG